jgi:hypothetical protein
LFLERLPDSWRLLPPFPKGCRDRFRQAAELLQDPGLGLRGGYALHLAVALHSRCNQPASFDGRMQQAAAALGMRPALE